MLELFSVRGRTSRLGYWRVVLLCAAVMSASWALANLAMIKVSPWLGVLMAPILAMLAVNLATALRRLHDRGKGAVWFLLLVPGPFVCLCVARALVAAGRPVAALVSLPFSLAGIGLGVWSWIEIGFLRGQPAANRFGEPPSGGAWWR